MRTAPPDFFAPSAGQIGTTRDSISACCATSRVIGPLLAAMDNYASGMRRRKFPWFPAAMLALESNRVVALRLMKLATGGRRARAEASRMVGEKVGEAIRGRPDEGGSGAR
jgi:hypothetical protein